MGRPAPDRLRLPVHARAVHRDDLGPPGRPRRLHRAPVDAHGRRGRLASFRPRTATRSRSPSTSPCRRSVVEGDALENLTWSPDVTIRDNDFDSNRARGVLVSTPGRVLDREQPLRVERLGHPHRRRRQLLVRIGRGSRRDDPGQRLRAGLPQLAVPVRRGHHQHPPGDPQARPGASLPPEHPDRGQRVPPVRLPGSLREVGRRPDASRATGSSAAVTSSPSTRARRRSPSSSAGAFASRATASRATSSAGTSCCATRRQPRSRSARARPGCASRVWKKCVGRCSRQAERTEPRLSSSTGQRLAPPPVSPWATRGRSHWGFSTPC